SGTRATSARCWPPAPRETRASGISTSPSATASGPRSWAGSPRRTVPRSWRARPCTRCPAICTMPSWWRRCRGCSRRACCWTTSPWSVRRPSSADPCRSRPRCRRPSSWPPSPTAWSRCPASRSSRRRPPAEPPPQSGAADLRGHRVDDLLRGDLADLAAGPVPHLHHTGGQAPADHDRGGNAQQLRVLELHARGDLGTVVVEHLEAARLERAGDPLRLGEDRRILAGGDDVHVGGGELPRP